MRLRSELPTKLCPVCRRYFSWRKKWERDWAQVKFCSDACRRGTPRGQAASAAPGHATNAGDRHR